MRILSWRTRHAQKCFAHDEHSSIRDMHSANAEFSRSAAVQCLSAQCLSAAIALDILRSRVVHRGRCLDDANERPWRLRDWCFGAKRWNGRTACAPGFAYQTLGARRVTCGACGARTLVRLSSYRTSSDEQSQWRRTEVLCWRRCGRRLSSRGGLVDWIRACCHAPGADRRAAQLEIACAYQSFLLSGKATRITLPLAGIVHHDFDFPRHI
jgi:hypothetical protein